MASAPQVPVRLHALDAVRAFALLLGIGLHAAHPYVPGLPWMLRESPSDTLAAVWYTIHMFRMPLFFLIAGFFGRMMLAQKGLTGFMKDRSRRIVLPLVVGFPVVLAVTGAGLFLGALVSGADPAGMQPPKPPPSPVQRTWIESVNLIHLWFLYYLVMLYAGVLLVRSVLDSAFGRKVQAAVDAGMRLLMRGLWAPLVLALPVAAYYFQLEGWSSYGGLPAPFSLFPDAGALLTYGLFFGFGWVLHRQQQLLVSLEKRWVWYCLLAAFAWILCRVIGGWEPHWGPYLKNGELLAYTVSYMTGAWALSLGLVGAALRFLSNYSPVRRYLADSSYWLYLMHLAALFFFGQVFHSLPLHWSLKYPLTIAASVLVLLLSYHYLVRFTFVGAMLNGRRRPRVGTVPPAVNVPADIR